MHRLLVITLWIFCCATCPAGAVAPTANAAVEVYYSPHGGCTEAIVSTLNAAKQSVLVQAYSFTSPPIESALAAAAKRGVKIQLILDRSNRTQKSSEAEDAVAAGLSVLIDAKHAIAHNKIMIVDGEVVITGSFNFTHNAEENNAENLLILHSKEVAARYTLNWLEHARHSEPFEGTPVPRAGRVSAPRHTAVGPDPSSGIGSRVGKLGV